MPRPLLLARHGETEWNAIGRLQGHTDIPLNERGRQQARELAAAVQNHGVATVITSDLARSHQTGAIIADALGLPPPRIVPELRERQFGVFEGLTRDQCQSLYPDAWRAWQAQTDVPPGAEAMPAAIARMQRVLESLVHESEQSALVISHGGVMRLWLVDLLGGPIAPLHNGTTYLVEHDGARFCARALR